MFFLIIQCDNIRHIYQFFILKYNVFNNNLLKISSFDFLTTKVIIFDSILFKKMEQSFSNRIKEVISYSREEALRLGHNFIGTEHLLLGIIREGEGGAIDILSNLKVEINILREKSKILVKKTT